MDEVNVVAELAASELMPSKSKKIYNARYSKFMKWCEEKCVKEYTENVLLCSSAYNGWSLCNFALYKLAVGITYGITYMIVGNTCVAIQLLVGAVSNIATIASGMNLGFSAVALPAMQAAHHLPKVSDEQASWVASLASIATPIGCFLTGILLEMLGRRRTLMVINAPAVLGWLLIATASHNEQWFFYQVYAGRILTGLATGLASSPSTVYISEVVDKTLRGMLVTWTTIGISLGILVVYILGSIFQESWRLVAGITACFPIAAIISVWFFVPESPVWLVSRGRVQEAELSMRRIRTLPSVQGLPDDLQQELDAMTKHGSQDINKKGNRFGQTIVFLKKPEAYKPLLIMNAFFFFQQFSGLFVVVFYAVSIVQETGVDFDGYLATIFIGITRLVVTIIISFASKRYGRRILANISGVGMTLSIGALATFLTLMHDKIISPEAAKAHSWFPISSLVMYILTSSVGFLTLPWAMIGEVFPSEIRGPACGITTCLGYLFSFIIIKVYPEMKQLWGYHGVFTFYTAMSLLGTISMFMYLPETQNRTLKQIEEFFKGEKKNIDRAAETFLDRTMIPSVSDKR